MFNELCDQIAEVELSMDFLLVGFDDAGEPHIFHIDGSHAPANYGDVGFCAIGSGAPAAQAALAFQVERANLGAHLAWPRAVYAVCDAKFRAEYASDVGHQTFLAIYERAEEIQLVSTMRVDSDIRATWEYHGGHRVPEKIAKAIPGMVYRPSEIGTEAWWGRFLGKGTAKTPPSPRERQVMREYQAMQRNLRHEDKIREPKDSG